MKILLLTLLPFFAFAQKQTYTLQDTNVRFDSTTGGMIYTEVVQVPNATADQLYSRAKSFIVKAFTNESAVTQADDKEQGLVSGRGKIMMRQTVGMMMLAGPTPMYYEMTAEIRVKDGRYKYEFNNIELLNQGMRIKLDDQFRKNPKAVQKLIDKEMSQKEYDKYMGDKNFVQTVVKQLKQTMNPGRDKNDF